jgi:hypothetical protein
MIYPPFTMAVLEAATQRAHVNARKSVNLLADARLLGGRVKPGHGEFLGEVK